MGELEFDGGHARYLATEEPFEGSRAMRDQQR